MRAHDARTAIDAHGFTASNGLSADTSQALARRSSPAASIPMTGGCSLLVNPPLVTVPISTDASGIYRLSASIPPHGGEALATVQALVADPTTAGGFASSNGVLLPIEP